MIEKKWFCCQKRLQRVAGHVACSLMDPPLAAYARLIVLSLDSIAPEFNPSVLSGYRDNCDIQWLLFKRFSQRLPLDRGSSSGHGRSIHSISFLALLLGRAGMNKLSDYLAPIKAWTQPALHRRSVLIHYVNLAWRRGDGKIPARLLIILPRLPWSRFHVPYWMRWLADKVTERRLRTSDVDIWNVFGADNFQRRESDLLQSYLSIWLFVYTLLDEDSAIEEAEYRAKYYSAGRRDRNDWWDAESCE